MLRYDLLVNGQIENLRERVSDFLKQKEEKEDYDSFLEEEELSFYIKFIASREDISFSEVRQRIVSQATQILLAYWAYGSPNSFVQSVKENNLKNAIFYGDVDDRLFLNFYLDVVSNISEKTLKSNELVYLD